MERDWQSLSDEECREISERHQSSDPARQWDWMSNRDYLNRAYGDLSVTERRQWLDWNVTLRPR